MFDSHGICYNPSQIFGSLRAIKNPAGLLPFRKGHDLIQGETVLELRQRASGMIKFCTESCLSELGIVMKEP
jgi:hypothetical protein